MAGINNVYLKEHKQFRVRNKRIIAMFPLIAVLIAIIVFWCLKLVGITITSDALCEVEEHLHTDTCYSSGELICIKPEHTHSSECFPDRTVDTETANDWTKTFANIPITKDVAKNLVSVATTQVGYTESDRNYKYNAIAEKNNYSRYGEWYGNPYGKWNTMFVSFCLNYANANNSDSLENSSAEAMRLAWQDRLLYTADPKYVCSRGDVVFFDTDSNGKADRTGIVVYNGAHLLMIIEGDVDGAVKKINYDNTDSIMGYGMTGKIYPAENTTDADNNQSSSVAVKPAEPTGKINKYIPNSATQPVTYTLRTRNVSEEQPVMQSVYDSEPLVMMAASGQSITYTSDLTGELVNAVFKEQSGTHLGDGDKVYVGQSYIVSLEFSEINTGNKWIQFEHNADGYLTYQLPSNIHCEDTGEWHQISAKTENGTVEDVGRYYIDESGKLKVQFFDDANGVNFVEKYANVDFSIDFNATVAATQSGTSTEIKFNDKIDINLDVDGSAGMTVAKSHGEYDSEDNTMEYTIRVEATHGVVKDLIIDDQIWENHYTLRDTIVVTDLDGNVLDPQPTVSNHPSHGSGADEGFRISGFPDFAAGDGFLIKYKTSIYDELLGNDTVDMWNGLDSYGKDSNGTDIYVWSDDWLRVELEKIEKEGKQYVLYDDNGNPIPVIEWGIGIRKNTNNLQGTVVIDTLGQGLEYYTGEPIRVKRYDEWGNRLSDQYISWDQVTITGNSMSFPLPDCYACDIVYYTTYEKLAADEVKEYTNTATVTINGKHEQTNGSADVVGFVPDVKKSASGNDGEYVYFEIEAYVPGVIENWGHFFLTDLAAFWGYKENDAGHLYVENVPEDLVITATTQSGQTITFTPYQPGGPIENTYILVSPAEGTQNHSFNVLFNTADATYESSKWLLTEDATLKVSYKIPFDAKTGTEWEGELKGDKTLEDVLLDGYKFANEAYLNYTDIIRGTGTATYEYSPKITKEAVAHDDGTIDYTVVFNNTVPGSNGDDGYLDGSVDNAWFTDTFDEKLEYVPGSLVVTGYSPWQKDLWISKYQYNGTVTGNEFEISARDFVFLDYNEQADAHGWNGVSGAATFRNYYRWINAGGKFVYTYKLKLKDEYLTTTDHSKFQLDNTAELLWGDDNTSGPATESTEYETGLLDKLAVQNDSKLDFQVHINRGALDILPNSDTIIIEDTMTDNLSVYWNSIKLKYENADGEWIDFDSADSRYNYLITYDPAINRLTFEVPDGLHIIIDYTTLITEGGLVSVENSVQVDGKAEVSDVVDAIFRVDDYSGGASGSNHEITLLKQDGFNNEPLQGAEFLLYGPMGDDSATRPAGAAPNIIAEDGTVLSFIGAYTTGDDGTCNVETQYLTPGGPYAFVEFVAPTGYELLTTPVYFYFFKDDPDGFYINVTTLIAIENFSGVPIIPETGGTGTFHTAIIGFAVTAFPILYSFIRRKRERRLTKIS